MAGRLVLVQEIGVRVPVREPKATDVIGCFCFKVSEVFVVDILTKESFCASISA